MHQDQPDYQISLVSFESHFDQMLPLMQSHFNEISYHTDYEFAPNKSLYVEAEKQGKMKLFVVKSGDSLIGYSTYFINKHNHVAILQAHQDSIYLKPDYRRHGIGKVLMQFAENIFKSLGVSVVFVSVSDKYDYSDMLIPMGYKSVEKLYARSL